MYVASSFVTFSIRQPYLKALHLVRRTLDQNGLRLPAELDVDLRIKRELGVNGAPRTILFVDDPELLLEGIVFHCASAVGIPQPVVVPGNDRTAEVFVRGAKTGPEGRFSATVHTPVLELEERIVGVIETIGDREEPSFFMTY